MVTATPEHVTIGVDGVGLQRLNGGETYYPLCKALQTAGTLYVAAGLMPTGIKKDVLNIKSPKDVIAVNRANEAIRIKLQAQLRSVRNDNPAKYSEMTKRKISVLTMYAAWITDGIVSFRITNFEQSPNNTISIHPNMVTGNQLLCLCPRGATPAVPPHWVIANHVELVKSALGALLPRASPVTVISITAQKIDWSQYGNCEADGSNSWEQPQ